MRNKKEASGVFTYKSILTGEYVLAQQWIAEVLVKRKADREEKPLPLKFWLDKNSPWTKEFKKQVQQAAKLINKYSEEAVLNFLKENPWKFSLFPKANLDKIAKAQHIIDNRPESIVVITQDAFDYVHRKNNKKSLLGKLNDSNKKKD